MLTAYATQLPTLLVATISLWLPTVVCLLMMRVALGVLHIDRRPCRVWQNMFKRLHAYK